MENDRVTERARLGVRHSLGSRFSLHIFLILFIVNLCSIFYIYRIEDRRNLRDLRHQGRIIGEYIATSVTPHILNYDYIALDKALGEAMHLQGLDYTAFLASNEVYVAGKLSAAALKKLSQPGSPALLPDQNQIGIVEIMRNISIDHIDTSTPVIFADEYLGRVIVGLSMEISRKKSREFLSILLVVNAVVALLLAGAIYLFFWRKALQPIYLLIDGAKRVEQGNLDEKVPLHSRDEFGLLADSFNTMMTARKQAEEETRKSRRDWERLFNSVEDMVTIQDNNTHIRQANAAACRLLGHKPEDLIGKHCYETLRGRTDPCPDCPVILCLQDHKVHHHEIEYPELNKTFYVSAFPLHDAIKGWVGVAHIARDISDQKKLEAQFRQAQKMEAIGTLAGGIAHDFNNILTPIFGYAQLIKMEMEAGSQMDKNVDQILLASQLAKKLVKQILTFSRERQQGLEELQIPPVIKESMKLLRASIPTSIEFKVAIDEECGSIMADPTQVHQIIMNLCTNAFHAMEASGGILGVSLTQVTLDSTTAHLKGNLAPGDYLELRISDTGTGMDAQQRERIFEPFFTTKEDGKGTGMGLSVVHGIVKNHGGVIYVYSEPGSGSTFTIYLPVVSSAKMPDALFHPPEGQIEFTGGNQHIMVVDDEEYIVALERRMLEKMGYRVSTFTVVSQALEEFKKRPEEFNLVITDMTMPKSSGLEFAEQLKAIRSDIPVILCTGHSRIGMEKLQQSTAINSFMTKPINLRRLYDSISEALGK